jgi:hypothetical protein
MALRCDRFHSWLSHRSCRSSPSSSSFWFSCGRAGKFIDAAAMEAGGRGGGHECTYARVHVRVRCGGGGGGSGGGGGGGGGGSPGCTSCRRWWRCTSAGFSPAARRTCHGPRRRGGWADPGKVEPGERRGRRAREHRLASFRRRVCVSSGSTVGDGTVWGGLGRRSVGCWGWDGRAVSRCGGLGKRGWAGRGGR